MTVTSGGDLVLVGAGGFGRETAEAVRAMNANVPRWRIVGFLDDDVSLSGSRIDGIPVLGRLQELQHLPNASVVICTGRPDSYASRPRIVRELQLPADRYATIVHPSAAVSASSRVGSGSVLLAYVVLTANVTVGSHVAVMPHVTFTHDDIVEDFVTLGSGVALGGGVRVGRCAYIGAGALIREHQTVGSGALVGMGAVVLTDVPTDEVWAGIPARRIRDIEPAATNR